MSQKETPDNNFNEKPLKKPRILPVSREEIYPSEITYTQDTIRFPIEEDEIELLSEEEEYEEEDEKTPERVVSILVILTMIPILLTSASFFWHLAFQEIHPIMHSIIDFVILVYQIVWVCVFASKEKLDNIQLTLLVFCMIWEILMLGNYSDMSHVYLQCLFSVPLMLALALLFCAMLNQEKPKEQFTGFLGECLWFLVVIGGLAMRVPNFRWIGFCQLVGVFGTASLLAVSEGNPTKRNIVLLGASLVAMIAVIVGFGA